MSPSSSDPSKLSPFKGTKKRAAIEIKPAVESDSSSPTASPSKKSKPRDGHKKTSTPADAWSPEMRLKLFNAFDKGAQANWEEIAKEVRGGKKASECRQQWSRATGKKIRKALLENKD